jgi:hypothetical protein
MQQNQSELFNRSQSEPDDIRGAVLLSLSQLAAEFKCARETMRTRLDQSNVQPAANRAGYPVYRLREAVVAWMTSSAGIDPETLPPFQRHASYKADRERIQLQTERGELVPVADVQREQARILTIMSRALDVLPDLVERDVGATADQLTKIEKCCDAVRDEMFTDLNTPPVQS